MGLVDWSSRETTVLKSPHDSGEVPESSLLSKWPGHVWLKTSGSTSHHGQWLALSFDALLSSAKAVNHHLQSDDRDIWLNPLPWYHVGGLGIFARAFLSRARVVELFPKSWMPADFVAMIEFNKVTLTSLVPTQVFDLVAQKLTAPKSLRAVVVGGGALSPELYRSARLLGWPLLPSFGMSECGSQIATADLASLEHNVFPKMLRLNHIEWRTDEEQRLWLKSPSLFSVKLQKEGANHWIPWVREANDWWMSQDRAKIDGDSIEPLGRVSRQVKILGELVDLDALTFEAERVARPVLGAETIVAVVEWPDSRKENDLILVTSRCEKHHVDQVLAQMNAQWPKYLQIQRVVMIDSFPRSELGKIRWALLKAQLRTLLST